MIPTRSFRVTLKDIAIRSGYTANTVSRALRDDAKLPEQTRAVIRGIAAEMGYIRNSLAHTLRSGSSHVVAVIVNDISNPYYSNMLGEIDRCLRSADYSMMILCTQLDETLAEKMIHIAISHSVDGVLFSPFNNAAHIRCLQKSGIPFVLLDRWVSGTAADVARLDDRRGGYLLARHLLGLGHRRMLYIAGPFVNSSQIDRQTGIDLAFAEAGIPRENLRVLPWDALPDEPMAGALYPLLAPLDYTAIIAYNDVIAYHCLNDLRAAGVRVPEDVSLVGFDHIRWCNSYLPPLTSLTCAGDSVAQTAVRMLLDRMTNRDAPPRESVLPVRIAEEGTAAAPSFGGTPVPAADAIDTGAADSPTISHPKQIN